MKWHATRREMFKGFGIGVGSTLFGPILSQLAAHAAGDAKATNKKRVVFVVQSNGMNPEHLRPQGVARSFKGDKPSNANTLEIKLGDKKLHPALEPLAPFRKRLALVQHLSGRIARSDHSANIGCLGACPANKGPMVQTIDHALAEAVPGVIPHVGIGLGGSPGTLMNYRLSASGPGQSAPVVCSPELAFKSLFGSTVEPGAANGFDARANLLDFMVEDVKRSRSGLAGEEKQKLDGYLAAFEALHRRQLELAGLRESIRANAPKLKSDQLKPTLSTVILQSQFAIGAAALIAGLTNVLLLTSGGGGQAFGEFPELGLSGLHGIGHGGSSMDGKPAPQCFTELRQMHCKLIAELATKLDAVQEGDGTMLDNTAIVYLSDSGDQHHPLLWEWPVVVLGNLGGKLKTNGRYLELPGYGQAKHRTLANFYCTLLHAVGKPRDKFGVPDLSIKDVDQTGPVPDLLA